MTNLTMLETQGKLTLKPRLVPIQTILKTARDEVSQIVSAHEHKLRLAFGEVPMNVRVDPEKTVSVFVNLLNNAVRFSPQRSEIILGATQQDDRIMAWVQDHGVGIAPDQLKRIFDGFYQAESPNTRHHGGLGIGLAIAKG